MTAHDVRPGTGEGPRPAGVVRVMTRNICVGASFDELLAAPTLAELAVRVDAAWQATIASHFPERARILGREIAQAAPDIVGLQEVARLEARRADAPPDVIDYLEILLAELSRAGARYRVASSGDAADVELAARDGTRVRLLVRNTIVARDGVEVSDALAAPYDARRRVIAGGVGGATIEVLRGWTSVIVRQAGSRLRVVNTHLETQPHRAIQQAQAEELVAALGRSDAPTLVVGDLNSDSLGGDTPTYAWLLASGLRDAWRTVRDDDGCTCCHAADLRNRDARFTKRIDHVLMRGPIEILAAELVGADKADRTPTGVWASDHAGVCIDVRVPL